MSFNNPFPHRTAFRPPAPRTNASPSFPPIRRASPNFVFQSEERPLGSPTYHRSSVDLNLMFSIDNEDERSMDSTFNEPHDSALNLSQASIPRGSFSSLTSLLSNVVPAPDFSTEPNHIESFALHSSARQNRNVFESPPVEEQGFSSLPQETGNISLNSGEEEHCYEIPLTTQGRKGGKKTSKDPSTKNKKPTSGRFFWDMRSQVILLECKKQYEEKRNLGDLYQKIKTCEEQWGEIASLCSLRGLVVEGQQAHEKFKRLSNSFREISDWERNTPSGKDSYWTMTTIERVAEGKFLHCNFPIELYELMDHLFGLDKTVNPSTNVIDTSNGLPGQGSTSTPQTGDIGSERAGFQSTPLNGGVPKKSRKRTHTVDVGLAEATKDLMKGWELAEEGKKARHEELADLEKKKLEISLLFATGVQGMSAALNKLAYKL